MAERGSTSRSRTDRAATGVEGLDAVLNGGLPRDWIYLVQGAPGTGKTTLGLQFLLAGVRAGERVLYVTLSHTERELREIARSHGWSLEGVPLFEVSAREAANRLPADQTVFHTDQVELGETIDSILEAVSDAQPERLVFDPVEQIRLLTASRLRYRRQLLVLKQALTDIPCTSLFLTGPSTEGESELESMVHGIVALERWSPAYGSVRRPLEIVKGRGMLYRGGYHSFRIRTGGLEMHPRLDTEPLGDGGTLGRATLQCGVEQLDTLLGGGLEEGTACLVLGPTGTGKTSIATLYVHAAVERGDAAAVFLFDERPETFFRRAEGLGMDLRPYHESGLVLLQQVSTGEISPGEFADRVRRAVELDRATVVVIDSLTGYLNAMPHELLLVTQMHELLTYLSQRGVLTLLVMAQGGVPGSEEVIPLDISYLVDDVLLLRHFETDGMLRRAISVIKKRLGSHESTIRELRLTSTGIHVGEPLSAFRNILSGTPTLLPDRHGRRSDTPRSDAAWEPHQRKPDDGNDGR
ncbi:MAG: ATPase domain-containing protein [Deinococcales bacterium]